MTTSTTPSPPRHVDVLVIGAGIAGINAAYHLKHSRPDTTFAVIEAHESYGGTWLIHTYPGVRSDTELYTLGYSFKPWTGPPYASGEAIRTYLGETIEEFELTSHFFYNRKVVSAQWSSEQQLWRLSGTDSSTGASFEITTNFLWMCHGYFNHDKGYTPDWPGLDEFEGRIIHPQRWPENPDLGGKKVVVIGSGATMATLVPEIADECASVTVLQRSPTYFFQSPNVEPLADQLRSLDTPEEWIHDIIRRKSVAEMKSLTDIQQQFPEMSASALISMVAAQLPDGYDVASHFTPRHLPSEQRVCRILDGDLFKKISAGRVTMVTDEIETFFRGGITTKQGTTIPADVVITATGFNLSVLGGISFTVDGSEVDFSKSVTHRGILFTELPNFAWSFGALRLSWTMRIDLVSQYLCRLLAHMEENHFGVVQPVVCPEENSPLHEFINSSQFNPGYAQRSRNLLARSGSTPEWQLSLDFWAESDQLPDANFLTNSLQFSSRGKP